MTITRAQVNDLADGDVVRVDNWQGLTVSGPVSVNHSIWLGDQIALRYADLDEALPTWTQADDASLTIVERAKLPLYVNHPRTKPVQGDVVLDADSDAWQFHISAWHMAHAGGRGVPDIRDCGPLRLLFDGETGEVVQ